MAAGLDRLDVGELVVVCKDTVDPLLRALEIAIYLEDVLGIVLPDEVLNEAHLGTPAAVIATVHDFVRSN